MDYGRKKGTDKKEKPAPQPAVAPKPRPGSKAPQDEDAMGEARTTEYDVRSGGKTTEYKPGQEAELAQESASDTGAEESVFARPPRRVPPPPPKAKKGEGKVVAMSLLRKPTTTSESQEEPLAAEPAEEQQATPQVDDELAGVFEEAAEAASGASEPPAAPPTEAGGEEERPPEGIRAVVEKVFNELLAPRLEALERLLRLDLLDKIDENDALDDEQKAQLKRTKILLESKGVVGVLDANDASLERMTDVVDDHDDFIHGHTDEDRAESEDILTSCGDHKPSLVQMYGEFSSVQDKVDEHGDTLDAAFRPDRARVAKILNLINQPLQSVLVHAIAAVEKKEDLPALVAQVAEIAVDDLPSDVKQSLEAVAKFPWLATLVFAVDNNITMKDLALPENAEKAADFDKRAKRVATLAAYCVKNNNWDELETQAAAKRAARAQSGGDS